MEEMGLPQELPSRGAQSLIVRFKPAARGALLEV